MSKVPSPSVQMENIARRLEGCIFPVPEEVVCSFFNIFFDVFWAKYKFGLCIKTWVCLFTIIFLPLKESLTLFQIKIFWYIIAYSVPFCVIENRVTKINLKYGNGNCYYSSCLGRSILFIYAPSAHKAFAF